MRPRRRSRRRRCAQRRRRADADDSSSASTTSPLHVVLRLEIADRPGLERQLGQQLLELLLVCAAGIDGPSSASARRSAARARRAPRRARASPDRVVSTSSRRRPRAAPRNSVAASLPVAAIVERRVLGQDVAPPARTPASTLVVRVVERFEHRDAAVAVAVGGRRRRSASTKKLGEPRLVALAAGLGRGDDRRGPGRRAPGGTRRSSSRC